MLQNRITRHNPRPMATPAQGSLMQRQHKFKASLAFTATIRQSELHRETVSKRKTDRKKGREGGSD